MKQMDAENLYRQLGRLIETFPEFPRGNMVPLTAVHLTWLGRASALLNVSGEFLLAAEFEAASQQIAGFDRNKMVDKIQLLLHKALARAELNAPAGARGAFIPAGNPFDAFAAVTKVLETATTDLLIVDPYLDASILTEFGGGFPANTTVRLMSDASSVKASLLPAATSWVQQHSHLKLLVRFTAPRTLHDRAIFVDGTGGWILTQSFKDFAKKSPAEIVRADDTASLKIAAYEALWTSAAIQI